MNVRPPRVYQIPIIENVKGHFMQHDRGQLTLSRGIGKTMITICSMNELQYTNIIVVVPTLDSMSHFFQEWHKQDPTINALFVDIHEHDVDKTGMVIIRKDKEIRRWVKNHGRSPKIIFSTYEASGILRRCVNKMQNRYKNDGYVFDICIFDDAHHIVGRDDVTTLLGDAFKVRKRLFLSGTPKIFIGYDNEDNDMKKYYMNNMELYGRNISNINNNGWIEYMFNELKEFVEYNKTLPLVTSLNRNERDIAMFCRQMRITKSALSSEMKLKFELLPVWSWKLGDVSDNNSRYYTDTRMKLKQLLDDLQTNKTHADIIMELPTLKDAHIYCKYNKLSGQFSGQVLEKYVKMKYDMTKNNASMCNGDLRHNAINIEIKISSGGKEHNKFNYVQLRMNHDCEYILTAYHLHYDNLDKLGELYIFRLTKDEIKMFILKYGSYAHGTVGELGKITEDDLNDMNNKKEYALRPKYGDKCWNELLLYRIDEIVV